MTQSRGSAPPDTLQILEAINAQTVLAVSAQCLISPADHVQACITTHILNTLPRPNVKAMDRYFWVAFPWRRKTLLPKPDGATREQTTHVAAVKPLHTDNDRDGDEDNTGIKILYDPVDVHVDPEVE